MSALALAQVYRDAAVVMHTEGVTLPVAINRVMERDAIQVQRRFCNFVGAEYAFLWARDKSEAECIGKLVACAEHCEHEARAL